MRRIMIVDDSEDQRKAISEALTNSDTELHIETDGPRCLKKLPEIPKVDILILDYNMPGMNGITLSQEIRKVDGYESIPIMIVTTETNPELRKKAMSLGVKSWIIKPINKENLNSTVSAIIKKFHT